MDWPRKLFQSASVIPLPAGLPTSVQTLAGPRGPAKVRRTAPGRPSFIIRTLIRLARVARALRVAKQCTWPPGPGASGAGISFPRTPQQTQLGDNCGSRNRRGRRPSDARHPCALGAQPMLGFVGEAPRFDPRLPKRRREGALNPYSVFFVSFRLGPDESVGSSPLLTGARCILRNPSGMVPDHLIPDGNT